MNATETPPNAPEHQSAHEKSNTQREQLPKDLLRRANAVSTLSKLLFGDPPHKGGSTQVASIAVCGGWGTGKTWFVKTWCEHLRQRTQARVVYLSAWENDYGDDPIASFLQQIKKDLPDKSWISQIDQWADENGDWVSLISSAVDMLPGFTPIKGISGAMFELLHKRQKGLSELKELLKEIAEREPLVVFVDELDRCRPLHAIAMLERIKHVFQVPGITFVLSIDKANLKKSIQSVYGQIDTDDYLRRFFTLEYHLPQISSTQFVSSLFPKEQLPPSDVVPTLLLASDISLRTMQRVGTGVNLLMNSEWSRDITVVKEQESNLIVQALSLYASESGLDGISQHFGFMWGYINSQPEDYPSSFPTRGFSDPPTLKEYAQEVVDFLDYQEHPANLSHLIQDFAWGIATSSIMIKCGIRMQPETDDSDGNSRLALAARSQTRSWDAFDNRPLPADTILPVQRERRKKCGDRYYMDLLEWISSMSIYCAWLIESNKAAWLSVSHRGPGLEKEVWEKASEHFLRTGSEITLSTESGPIDADKWAELHEYTNEHFEGDSQKQTGEDLKNVRNVFASKALAAASVATARVCRVMRDTPGAWGMITGNRHDG